MPHPSIEPWAFEAGEIGWVSLSCPFAPFSAATNSTGPLGEKPDPVSLI